METKPQHIIKLEVENVKRVHAAQIDADGKPIIIGGENEAGKSSVIDAIQMAVGGARHACKNPLKNGEEHGEIILTTEDFVITKTFVKDGKSGKLTITNPDGAVFKGGQGLLDSFYNACAFDPLAFKTMNQKEQLAAMKKLLGLDTDTIDALRKEAYDARTVANREVKRIDTLGKSMPFHADAPAVEVLISDLLAEQRVAQAHNGKKQELVSLTNDWEDTLNVIDRQIETKEVEIKKLYKNRSEAASNLQKNSLESDKIDIIDISTIDAKLANAETINQQVRENIAMANLKNEFTAAKAKADELDVQVKDLDKQKAGMIANANYPVDGLAVTDDGVTFKGIDFCELSTAEALLVSASMVAAMNPTLRIMLIREGSLLDRKHTKLLMEFAKENDMQPIIEIVGERDDCSVIIEDGRVK